MKKALIFAALFTAMVCAASSFAEGAAPDPDEVKALKGQILALQKKYDVLKDSSGNVQAIIEERDALSEEKTALSQEAGELRAQMGERESSSRIKWLLSGAAIFAVGWLVGTAGGKKRRGTPYY